MSKKTREFYISVDVEADGPCPGINSMLQLGAVFYDANGKFIKELRYNIEEIDGAVQDASTMQWWREQEVRFPGIWDRMMLNRMSAKEAMARFEVHVHETARMLHASPVVVAYPAGYDFTYLYWYLCKFNGKSCVGFSAIDMKSVAMTLIKRSYHDSAKKRFPREWFNPALKHTHDALDDAHGQGYTFFQMKKAIDSGVVNSPQVVEESDNLVGTSNEVS